MLLSDRSICLDYFWSFYFQHHWCRSWLGRQDHIDAVKKPEDFVKEPRRWSRIFQQMLVVQGFGKNKAKRYGEGQPPKSWPVAGFPWTEFKGTSITNNLTPGVAVHIICSMLTWAGYNPETYVKAKVSVGVEAVFGGWKQKVEAGVEAETCLGAGG